MSSAILYVAIVVIWIGVLVPRWLRHDNSHSGPAGLRRFSRHFGGSHTTGSAETPADPGPDGRARDTSFVPPEPQTHAPGNHQRSRIDYREQVFPGADGKTEGMTQLYDAPPAQVRSRSAPAADTTRTAPLPSAAPASATRPAATPASEAPHYRDDAGDAERRARMVRGRRRMLWLLLVLTVAGAGLAYLRLAAWWIMIPPTVLLCGYLLLLREAARADAEARERREMARAASQADRDREPADRAKPAPATAEAAAETGPHADIIDISEHVGDQLYDQYADAKLRAVGD